VAREKIGVEKGNEDGRNIPRLERRSKNAPKGGNHVPSYVTRENAVGGGSVANQRSRRRKKKGLRAISMGGRGLKKAIRDSFSGSKRIERECSKVKIGVG